MNARYREEIAATLKALTELLEQFDLYERSGYYASDICKVLTNAAGEASDVHTLIEEHIQRYEGDRSAG